MHLELEINSARAWVRNRERRDEPWDERTLRRRIHYCWPRMVPEMQEHVFQAVFGERRHSDAEHW